MEVSIRHNGLLILLIHQVHYLDFTKGGKEMTIEYRHGHYVVLDDNGNVYCSCDTHKEAADEIAEAKNN